MGFVFDKTEGTPQAVARPNLASLHSLELVVFVLAEAGRNQGAGLWRTDGLARAGFGENDMPEIGVWRDEGDANKAPLALLPQGSDTTVGRFCRHLIENADVLAGDKRSIHQQQRPVRADHVGGRLQIYGFAF